MDNYEENDRQAASFYQQVLVKDPKYTLACQTST